MQALAVVSLNLLIVVALFGLVIVLLVHYWRRVVDGSLTAHFRAAERISQGYLPPQWASEIERQLRFRRWQRALLPAGKQTGTALALAKLEKLARFFANSTFFEDATAKTILLDELASTRQRWEGLSWEELRKIIPP